MGRYHDLIDRLAHIPGFGRECLGHVGSPSSDYPFYRVHSQGISRGEALRRICLAAGVHGDEPAGVEAVVRFLEKKPNFDGSIFLSAFPCLNPMGYDRGTRENGEGMDLNREFHQRHPPQEVLWARQAASKDRYDLFICCHDDVDANGFYLYEAKRERGPGLGPSIVSAIREVAPIDRRPTIDGRTNHGGVIRPTNWHRRTTGWSMALYLYKLGTPHCLILETPTSLPFEEQVRIHLKALDHVFASFLEGRFGSGSAGRRKGPHHR